MTDYSNKMDDDQEINRDETPDCPLCDGYGVLSGRLGHRLHFRCRQCGIDFSHEVWRFTVTLGLTHQGQGKTSSGHSPHLWLPSLYVLWNFIPRVEIIGEAAESECLMLKYQAVFALQHCTGTERINADKAGEIASTLNVTVNPWKWKNRKAPHYSVLELARDICLSNKIKFKAFEHPESQYAELISRIIKRIPCW